MDHEPEVANDLYSMLDSKMNHPNCPLNMDGFYEILKTLVDVPGSEIIIETNEPAKHLRDARLCVHFLDRLHDYFLFHDNETEIKENLRLLRKFIVMCGYLTIYTGVIEFIIDYPYTLATMQRLCFYMLDELFDAMAENEFSQLKLNVFYVCRIMDILLVCGDYDMQVMLLKNCFKIISVQKGVQCSSTQLLPTSGEETLEMRKLLDEITAKNFETSCAAFLKKANEFYKSVFSVSCSYVGLETRKLFQNIDDPIFLHFNHSSKSISFRISKENVFIIKFETITCSSTRRTGENQMDLMLKISEHADIPSLGKEPGKSLTVHFKVGQHLLEQDLEIFKNSFVYAIFSGFQAREQLVPNVQFTSSASVASTCLDSSSGINTHITTTTTPFEVLIETYYGANTSELASDSSLRQIYLESAEHTSNTDSTEEISSPRKTATSSMPASSIKTALSTSRTASSSLNIVKSPASFDLFPTNVLMHSEPEETSDVDVDKVTPVDAKNVSAEVRELTCAKDNLEDNSVPKIASEGEREDSQIKMPLRRVTVNTQKFDNVLSARPDDGQGNQEGSPNKTATFSMSAPLLKTASLTSRTASSSSSNNTQPNVSIKSVYLLPSCPGDNNSDINFIKDSWLSESESEGTSNLDVDIVTSVGAKNVSAEVGELTSLKDNLEDESAPKIASEGEREDSQIKMLLCRVNVNTRKSDNVLSARPDDGQGDQESTANKTATFSMSAPLLKTASLTSRTASSSSLNNTQSNVSVKSVYLLPSCPEDNNSVNFIKDSWLFESETEGTSNLEVDKVTSVGAKNVPAEVGELTSVKDNLEDKSAPKIASEGEREDSPNVLSARLDDGQGDQESSLNKTAITALSTTGTASSPLNIVESPASFLSHILHHSEAEETSDEDGNMVTPDGAKNVSAEVEELTSVKDNLEDKSAPKIVSVSANEGKREDSQIKMPLREITLNTQKSDNRLGARPDEVQGDQTSFGKEAHPLIKKRKRTGSNEVIDEFVKKIRKFKELMKNMVDKLQEADRLRSALAGSLRPTQVPSTSGEEQSQCVESSVEVGALTTLEEALALVKKNV